METERLGDHGPAVSRLGLGCMFYGSVDEEAALGAMATAIESGVTHFDTADVYEGGRSENLVGRALRGNRGVVLATKFGIKGRRRDGTLELDNRPRYVREACEASLRRLGVDAIDLYYLHRFDPEIPIEESVGAMAQLVDEGKVRYLGLSEVSETTLRRAHAVHPIAAVQCEYSLWSREIESDLLPTCRALAVATVAYCPLGRGYLAGAVRDRNSLAEQDLRRTVGQRFSDEGLRANGSWLRDLEELAFSQNLSSAQIALAWLLAQGDDIFPIPGSTNVGHIRSNVAASRVRLDESTLQRIASLSIADRVFGTRYPEAMEKQLRQ